MEALHQWYEEVLKHIRETDLKNLSEYETENGQNPFQKFTDVTRSKESLKPFSYSDFKHGDEFNFLSMDLIYIVISQFLNFYTPILIILLRKTERIIKL